MANLVRGFRRLTWVISGLVVVPLTVLGLMFLDYEHGGAEAAGVFFGVAALVFGVLWLGFFLIRWVVRGFEPAPPRRTSRAGVSLQVASGLPIFLMEKRETPFDDWHAPGTSVPANLEGLFQRTVWGYQLFLFRRLFDAKFGADAGRRARDHQDAALRRLANGLGDDVLEAAQAIEQSAATLEVSESLLEQQEAARVPPEYPLALQTLLVGRHSPYLVPPEDRTVERMQRVEVADDHDLLLAQCMAHARRTTIESLGESIAIMEIKPHAADRRGHADD